MANKRISELPDLTSPDGQDFLPVVDASEPQAAQKNKRLSLTGLASWLGGLFLGRDEPARVQLRSQGVTYLDTSEGGRDVYVGVFEQPDLWENERLAYFNPYVSADGQTAGAYASAGRYPALGEQAGGNHNLYSDAQGMHADLSLEAALPGQYQARQYQLALAGAQGQPGGRPRAVLDRLLQVVNHLDPARSAHVQVVEKVTETESYVEFTVLRGVVSSVFRISEAGLFLNGQPLASAAPAPPAESPAQQGVVFDGAVPYSVGATSLSVASTTPLIDGVERTVPANANLTFTAAPAGEHKYVGLVLNFANPASPYYQVVEGDSEPVGSPLITPALDENAQKWIAWVYVTAAGGTTTSTVLDATVTQTGQHAVKGSGIWSFVMGLRGAVNGLASLDATGKVPAAQLPTTSSHTQNTDTGTNATAWQIGQGAAGSARTLEAVGTASDVGLSLKPKGTGKVKLEGPSYAGATAKTLILNANGEVEASYEVSEEQVAVPSALNLAGIPGTWAREPGFLYFCYGAGWEKLAAISSALNYLEVWTAIPVSPTSAGTQGQKAYDEANSLLYECVATNKWVRYSIVKTW